MMAGSDSPFEIFICSKTKIEKCFFHSEQTANKIPSSDLLIEYSPNHRRNHFINDDRDHNFDHHLNNSSSSIRYFMLIDLMKYDEDFDQIFLFFREQNNRSAKSSSTSSSTSSSNSVLFVRFNQRFFFSFSLIFN